MKRVVTLLLFSAIFIAGCSLAGDVTPPADLATAQAAQAMQSRETPSPQPIQNEETAEEGASTASTDLQAGAVIYGEKCAPCHGETGLGDGALADNLAFPPSPLGDQTFMRQAIPSEWYSVVTEGRIERVMPPFESLSDAERWVVVTYALNLGVSRLDITRAQTLFESHCATCHGQGGTGGVGPDLTAAERMLSRSRADLFTSISEAGGEMPAFAGILDEADRWSLAAHVQQLALDSAPADQKGAEETNRDHRTTAAIQGKVLNGTTGMMVPAGLEAQLIVIEGEEISFGETIVLDEAGYFIFDDIEILPERVFGVAVIYQGVQYFSEVIHLTEDQPTADVTVVIYETTADTSNLVVERLHVLFDTSVEGQIHVTELWVLSNRGDYTVAYPDPQRGLAFLLPDGFSNLSFASDADMMGRYVMTEQGFADLTPLRPDEGSQVVFSFTLPYSRRLEFKQNLGIEVEAIVIIIPEGSADVKATGLQDSGIQDMGGRRLHNYRLGSFAAGDVLELRLSEGSPILLYGLIGLLAVGIAVAFWWFGTRRAKLTMADLPVVVPVDRQSAIEAIAALDDAYEAGEISGEDYRAKRNALKAEALRMMRGMDD